MTTERKIETIDVIKQMVADGQISQDVAEKYFPELKESEDEKWIPKEIAKYLKEKGGFRSCWIAWLEKQGNIDSHVKLPTFTFDDILALQCCMKTATANEYKELYVQLKSLHDRVYDAYWLEKQGGQKHAEVEPKFKVGDVMRTLEEAEDGITDGLPIVVSVDERNYHCTNELISIKDQDEYEYPPMNRKQKPVDKVEPKFHEGDWVFIEEVKGYKNGPFQIKVVDSFGYSFDEYHTIPFMYEEILSKWTMQDVNTGDVLATKDAVFIFKYMDKTGLSLCKSYCEVIGNSKLGFGFEFSINGVYPATKEQHDILMKAITDAGYTFDFEKKELKKNLKE